MFFITEVIQIGQFNPVSLSLIAMSVILLLSKRRREIIKNVDWSTIVFFIGLFIFTQGVLSSGVINLLTDLFPLSASIGYVLLISVLYSQILSNVPMVAIYIPLLRGVPGVGTFTWLALAAGSTIAGNLTLLGAASNIIISEMSETRDGPPLHFLEFSKYGIAVTLVNVMIYYLFLMLPKIPIHSLLP
ncbi:hypothetical protein HS7_05270 [Sulfolobales archaeon HS-7]|nr:hypothetical protein HS7_05270 [Sulfolobales archaeon HS-7]